MCIPCKLRIELNQMDMSGSKESGKNKIKISSIQALVNQLKSGNY